MKKHLPGFAPINFKKIGKAFLLMGLVIIVMKGIEKIAGGVTVAETVFFVGGAMFLIGSYMVFAVTEE